MEKKLHKAAFFSVSEYLDTFAERVTPWVLEQSKHELRDQGFYKMVANRIYNLAEALLKEHMSRTSGLGFTSPVEFNFTETHDTPPPTE